MSVRQASASDLLHLLTTLKPDVRVELLGKLKTDGSVEGLRTLAEGLREGFTGLIDSLGYTGHDRDQVEYIRLRYQSQMGLILELAGRLEEWDVDKDRKLFPESYKAMEEADVPEDIKNEEPEPTV